MSFRVVKNVDGGASLYVDDELDLIGDDDAIDERLWQLYGTPDVDEGV